MLKLEFVSKLTKHLNVQYVDTVSFDGLWDIFIGLGWILEVDGNILMIKNRDHEIYAVRLLPLYTEFKGSRKAFMDAMQLALDRFCSEDI